MKSICFISNLFPSREDPSFGSFVGLSYQQLKNMGYHVDEPIVINVRLKPFKKIIAYSQFFLKGIIALMNKKYDLFYIHYLTYSTLCLLPVLPFKKVTYLINIHGDDLVGTRLIHKIMGLPSGYVLKHASAVVVPSEYFKTQLLARFPFICQKKIVISESGGFKEDIFFPKDKDKTSEPLLHFGYISRVDEGKGWEVMLQALSILKQEETDKYTRLTVSVYGAGAQKEKFQGMVNKLELNDIVTYYGPLEQSGLGGKYRSFDYFLFPTRRESFGLVAIESLACGTPVICSEIEPLTDIIRNGDNGFLFESGSSDALYEKIVDCFGISKKSYEQLSENALLSADFFRSVNVSERLHQKIESIFH
ncbi:MAG: glycosyltransferase involved in cell wall biosynthesis [Alteromonadaceae bacterium]|jgi:glycosyltransferase involved in cell wall biosynthesis